MIIQRRFLLTICLLIYTAPAFAGKADIVQATAQRSSNGSYGFSVTLSHEDTGWEHYANKWDVVAEDGTILGTRTLHHPHVDEQPFTRSLSGVKIPDDVKTVTIRAHDSVHGYGGKLATVDLTQ
jgi:hypothetical protein